MPDAFAKRLRTLRLACGWTQTQFAAQLGPSYRSRIAHWETGRCRPYFNDLPRVAEMLGVTTDFLLTGRESPQMERMALRLDAANQEIVALRAPRARSVVPFRIGQRAA